MRVFDAADGKPVYFLTRWTAGCRTVYGSLHLERHHRLVVEGRHRELVERGENRGGQGGGGEMAIAPDDVGEAAAAELVAGGVQMIRDAVRVEHHRVAGAGIEMDFLVLARVEQ